MLVGAGIGGLLGFLYLTDAGRRLRQELEPWLDDVIDEARQMRRTIQKAREATQEAWLSLNELAGQGWEPDRLRQSTR